MSKFAEKIQRVEVHYCQQCPFFGKDRQQSVTITYCEKIDDYTQSHLSVSAWGKDKPPPKCPLPDFDQTIQNQDD